MFSRTVVGIQTGAADAKVEQSTKLPEVFLAPIRADLVQSVHTNMRKNSRQAYAVSKYAGKDSSAESWGTGRAVARIPRVAGGGTHRAGQGAFGNMCRGGRRFAPTKTWRRWHRMTNITQKRYAVAAAIAASAVPALVTARGHQIESVAEIPLVVSNKAFDSIVKTSQAVAFLKAIKADNDVDKVKESVSLRKGVGKMRNRRFVQRRGPLVVFNTNGPLVKAFRNIPGVELANVNTLSLLQLAPGGHVGRFIIWVEDAFNKLNQIFGTYKTNSEVKTGYRLPRSIVTNPDISKIIQSDEIFAYLKDKKTPKSLGPKRNPLKNVKAMTKLNPYGVSVKRNEFALQQQRNKKKAAAVEAKRTGKTVEPTAAQKKDAEAQKKNKVALIKRVKPQASAFGKALSAK